MSNTNTSFDPFTQNLTGLMKDGTTPFIVNLADLDSFLFYNAKVCINYGAQMGASIVMFAVVLATTRENKRRSPLFFLNLLSLAFSTLRSLLQVLYYTNTWTELYVNFSPDYSYVPRSDYATSIANVIIIALLVITIELSLLMQTQVVCVTLEKKRRWAVMALSYCVALLAIGFRLILMVENAIYIMRDDVLTWEWLFDGTLITETISVWYFCLVFVIKLGITIFKRKKMGLKQFGPMQIICIMGGCTMIVPSIFAILEYVPSFPQASSIAITAVAILLPLSSLWASASVEGKLPRFTTDSTEARRKLFGSYSSGQPSTRDRQSSLSAIHSASLVTRIEHGNGFNGSPSTVRSMPKSIFDEEVLEGGDIRVQKSYSIRSGQN